MLKWQNITRTPWNWEMRKRLLSSTYVAIVDRCRSEVKSLSRVWLFVTPVDCSVPGCSVRGILQARILEWVAISFSRGVFPTQWLNPGLPHWRRILYPLSRQAGPTAQTMGMQGGRRKTKNSPLSRFCPPWSCQQLLAKLNWKTRIFPVTSMKHYSIPCKLHETPFIFLFPYN